MKKSKGLTMNKTLLLFALIPLTTALIILSIVSGIIMTKNVEENIKEELLVSAKSLQEYYQYDLINGIDLVDGFCEYDTTYIDEMAKTGVDFTLFKDNIRFMTTIVDKDSGKRIEGTPASDAVWAEVSKGNDYYSDDVVINGIDYYVYYLPLGTEKVYGMAFAGKPATDVQAAEKHLYILIISLGIVMEIIFIALVLLISRKITKPLELSAEALEKLSNGELDIENDATSHIYETKKVISSLDKLTNMLKNTIFEIVDKTKDLVTSSDKITSSSDENATSMVNLSQASTEIATGATSQAEEVQNAAESVADVVVNIEHITDAVKNTKARAEAMSEDSSKVSSDFDELIKDTNTGIDKLSLISEKMNSVALAVDEVQNAAGEINNIASQTNLLSLNASIEAARAGEAGRGFAVVAGEISSLSDQSDKAAGSIKDIMTNLEAQTKEAVMMVTELSEIMQRQGETSEKSQNSLGKLLDAITETKEQVDLVENGALAVSDICDKLNEIIQNLSAISEENAASTQETSASITQVTANTDEIKGLSNELKQIADTLSNLTSYFSIDSKQS